MNIYKNIKNKNYNNNKEYCFLKNTNNNFNNFFEDTSSIYKNKYLIKTDKKEYNTYLIGKTDNYIVTFNEEKIFLKDIVSIEIIKQKNIN